MARGAGRNRVFRDFDRPRPRRMHGDVFAQPDRESEQREHAFRHMILSIPAGRVSSYGRVAVAAGYPKYHRAVARLLRHDPHDLPWHRVLGADGRIKLVGDSAHEQASRLRLEGVPVQDGRVEMDLFEYTLRPWDVER